MPLQWNGDRVRQRLHAAAARAVNATVDEAAADARLTHVWINRRGQLEEEIVSKHADPADPNPTASFGTTRRRGFYGLFHEEGTKSEMERPFLRPAADRHFHELATKIREELR